MKKGLRAAEAGQASSHRVGCKPLPGLGAWPTAPSPAPHLHPQPLPWVTQRPGLHSKGCSQQLSLGLAQSSLSIDMFVLYTAELIVPPVTSHCMEFGSQVLQ